MTYFLVDQLIIKGINLFHSLDKRLEVDIKKRKAVVIFKMEKKKSPVAEYM